MVIILSYYIIFRNIVNPGFDGQALDFDCNAPYSIPEESPDGFHVIERRVPYDIETAISNSKKDQHIYQWYYLVRIMLFSHTNRPGLFWNVL